MLGGGGLKGLAHIGVWQALQESSFRPAGIVGTSIGALVGAAIAAGKGWRELAPKAVALEKADIIKVNRMAVWVNGIRETSLFRGETLRAYIGRTLPVKEWEELVIPLQVNAVDLATGETVWFGPGARTDVPIADAVYASSALPVFYPPARLDGGWYVDGGTGEALGLERARELGATGIVAVDAGSGPEEDVEKILDQGMIAVHQRTFAIMSGRRRRDLLARWDALPLLLVRPRLDGYSTFDFDHLKYFLEEGYRAARTALGGARAPAP